MTIIKFKKLINAINNTIARAKKERRINLNTSDIHFIFNTLKLPFIQLAIQT